MNEIFEQNKNVDLAEQEQEHGLLEAKNADRGLLETSISKQMVIEHPSYKELLEQFSQEEQKAQDFRNKWLLAQADFENLKRRTEREIANAHKYAIEKFALEVLATVDNLERSLAVKIQDNVALNDFYVGIELTLKHLLEVLQKFGITSINPVGEEFDHEKHTAVTTKEEPTAKPNAVLEVIQKGYWFKDRLLRPALVVVAK